MDSLLADGRSRRGGAGAECLRCRADGVERDIRALLRPANLGGIALAFGAAGLAHGLDDEFSGRVDNAALEPVLDFGNFYFGTRYSVGSVVGMWGLSKVAGLEEVHAASGEVLRALVGPLKLVAGRTRPDGSNDHSFSSGHSANAFAISTVLGRRYGRGVGVPLFALAGTVPVARIHDRATFFPMWWLGRSWAWWPGG